MSEKQPVLGYKNLDAELAQLGLQAAEAIRQFNQERAKVVYETYDAWNAVRGILHADYDRYHDNPGHDEPKFVAVCGQLTELFENNPEYGQRYTDSQFPNG
ncbi:MAG: hypothetical protein ABI602_02860 [Candidatus Saccharibacteria bacterium]